MLSAAELAEVEELISQDRLSEAEGRLTTLADQDNPDWCVCMGCLLNRQGRLEEAYEKLEKALELDPQHRKALFHLAYTADLHGDDQRAAELYEQCISQPPLHVNALINLAVLYEDHEYYDKAETCLQQVLDVYPSHARAHLFLRDVQSAKEMYYDEDLEKSREQHSAILDIPISDFELSVRSRNCLKKMNIHTLGDILRTTEAQLLSYKNFGETSLNEIKTLLTQKGLRIGQALEEQGEPSAAEAESGLPEVGDAALFRKQVSELELSVRSRKCLQRLGITTLGELAGKSETDLLEAKNFGQTSLGEIRLRLAEHGLGLRKTDSRSKGIIP